MTFDRWFLIALAIFLLLFGVFAVTNLRVEWGSVIMGYAALIAGILGVIVAVMGFIVRRP